MTKTSINKNMFGEAGRQKRQWEIQSLADVRRYHQLSFGPLRRVSYLSGTGPTFTSEPKKYHAKLLAAGHRLDAYVCIDHKDYITVAEYDGYCDINDLFIIEVPELVSSVN